MDALGRVLVVIYTWRGERVRLISARQERRKYEESHEARIRFQPRQTRTCNIGSKGQDQNHNPTGRRCARLVSPTGGFGWRKLSDFNQRCAAAYRRCRDGLPANRQEPAGHSLPPGPSYATPAPNLASRTIVSARVAAWHRYPATTEAILGPAATPRGLPFPKRFAWRCR